MMNQEVGMLVVNCMDITEFGDELYEEVRHIVSEERRIKAERYHNLDDSKRCICADLLLRYGLYQKTGKVGDINITFNEFGKPFIKNMIDFKYNITHSGKWVAIVYGNTDAGIDVERIQKGREEIADFCFSEEEKLFIYNKADKYEQVKQFTKLWTMKESYIKFLGTGFSTNLDSFSINALEGVITNRDGEVKKDIKVRSFQFDTDYYLSICSMEAEFCLQSIKLEEITKLLNMQ